MNGANLGSLRSLIVPHHNGGASRSQGDDFSESELAATTNPEGKMLQKSPRLDARTVAAIAALTLCYVGSQVSNFLAGPGLNFVAAALDIGAERSWISTSSSLATACIVPVAGYLQDMIGRKGLLIGSLILVLVGAIVSATAQSFAQLIAGSVLTGLGTGIEELTAFAAIAELVPVAKRGLYFGFTTFSTIIFGPSLVYASQLSVHASWRWLHWISLIWNAVAAILTAATYLPMKLASSRKPGHFFETLKSFDLIGTILLIAGSTELLIALQSGGILYSWKSAYVLVQLLVGIGLLCLLLIWESFGIGRPLIPFRLFQGQRIIGLTFGICILSGVLYSTLLTLGPTILEEVFQFSILRSGLVSTGTGFALTIGATTLNAMLTILNGRARELLLVSAIIMTGFTGAQACISPNDVVTWAVLGSFAGLGVGGVLVPVSTIVTIACPQDLIGTAVGLVITLRTIGGSIGYAIFYNIYTNYSQNHIPKLVGQYAVSAGLPESQAAALAEVFIKSQNPTNATLGMDITNNMAILEAAHRGFEVGAAGAAKLVFYGSIPFGVGVILCSICLPDLKKFLSNRVMAWHESKKEVSHASP